MLLTEFFILFLSLLVCGVKEGDEVIVPTWTFVATSHVVLWCGARPVLCDVEEETLNIDVGQMERLVTSRTKAIIPVHFAGYPCKMDEIVNIANRYRLMVIEDAAHAHGAMIDGVKAGNIGDIGCFSFYPTKPMTVGGEGGIVATNDEKISKKVRSIIDVESSKGTSISYNFRMSEIQAAIGRVQLKRFPEFKRIRQSLAKRYYEKLKDIPYIELLNHNYDEVVPHIFPIKIVNGKRDELRQYLLSKNIECGIHYYPNHLLSFYGNRKGELPVTEKSVSYTHLTLPTKA